MESGRKYDQKNHPLTNIMFNSFFFILFYLLFSFLLFLFRVPNSINCTIGDGLLLGKRFEKILKQRSSHITSFLLVFWLHDGETAVTVRSLWDWKGLLKFYTQHTNTRSNIFGVGAPQWKQKKDI